MDASEVEGLRDVRVPQVTTISRSLCTMADRAA
jgi:hypothetical protein